MKDKEILNQIKQDMIQKTPEVLQKIDFNAIEIKPKKAHKKWSIRQLLMPLSTVLTLATVLVVMLLMDSNPIGPNPIEQLEISSQEEMVAFQAVSGISLVEEQITLVKRMKQSSIQNTQVVDVFHQYNHIFESLLVSEEGLKKYYNDGQHAEYPKARYPYVMEASLKDITGQQTLYKMYYNYDIEQEEDELEIESYGYILIHQQAYSFEAKREKEADEQEISLEIHLGQGTYIEIERESGVNEYELSYAFYENGKLKKEIKLEMEAYHVSLEIKLEDQEYLFEYELSLKGYQIYYEYLEEEGTFTLEVKDQVYQYTYNQMVIIKS